MQEFYYEWASKVNARGGRMLPVSTLEAMPRLKDPGFRSVYLFYAEDAQSIISSGHSSGFARYEPTSDILFIDLDDGELQLPALEGALSQLGLAYEVWSSGGKGYHFHIQQEIVTGFDVPYSQRAFVESLGVKFDASIYQPNSLIALPNRKHPRTGKLKSLVRTVEGRPLMLPIVPTPESHKPFEFLEEGSEDQRVMALSMLAWLVKEPEKGKRHIAIWRTAKTMAAAGFSFEFAELTIMEIISTWTNQKSHEESLKPIKAAYRQLK